MTVRLEDMLMTPSGRRRWQSLPEEDRDILSAVFEEALARPEWVGDFEKLVELLPCGTRYASVRFRFGYANYYLYLLRNTPILHDTWLDPIPE